MATPSAPTPQKGKRGRRLGPGFAMILLLLLGYWTMAAGVLAVDPLDLYPWGARPNVASRWQSTRALDLLSVVARDPSSNTVVVGSSTTMPYRDADIRAALPDARNPWNISYGGSRPMDRHAALMMLASSDTPHRIIVSLDWSYVTDAALKRPDFHDYLYDDSPFNDLRQVNGDNLKLIADWTRTGRLVESDAPYFDRDWAARERQKSEWHAPGRQAEVRRVLANYRPRLATRGFRRCDQLTAVTEQLIPSLRTLAAKGNRIDILVPPYSPLMYLPIANMRERVLTMGDSLLSDQMLLRRCTVMLTAGIPNVAVWAPDKDLSLIGDFSHFNDPGHLVDRAALQEALDAIGDPRYRLTPANVDAYLNRLWRFSLDYVPDSGPAYDAVQSDGATGGASGRR